MDKLKAGYWWFRIEEKWELGEVRDDGTAVVGGIVYEPDYMIRYSVDRFRILKPNEVVIDPFEDFLGSFFNRSPKSFSERMLAND